MSDFHLRALQLGAEDEMLERAIAAFDEVAASETIFLPEYLAWTPRASGIAFAKLIGLAQERNINIITTLNLGGELTEDLPGVEYTQRYNSLAIFTRHGVAHVPQAKISPQSFEMDTEMEGPGICVEPYARLNRVRLDIDDQLLDTYFLICSDLLVLEQLKPDKLACDLLVVLGNFAYGAEKVAARLLTMAIEHGVAETALLVNAFQLPVGRKKTLAIKAEEVFDATRARNPARRWSKPRSIRSAFHVYPDRAAKNFVQMCKLPRKGRIAVPESRWRPEITVGNYPITVVF